MTRFLEEYADAYPTVHLERRDGILLVRLHSDGSTMVWGDQPHRDLSHVFHDIALDPDNEIVILTGTGDAFMTDIDRNSWGTDRNGAEVRDRVLHECRLILRGLLDIPVPVIGAVNGPARLHAELILLSDIVVASETAVFQDAAHFQADGVPGDGVHVLWPMWLGPNRARQFLLMGQEIPATEALEFGIVAEVVAPEMVLDRAWEIARDLATRSRLTLRYTRSALTIGIRRALDSDLGEGLALEFLGRAFTRPGR